MSFWFLFPSRSIQNILSLSAIVAPFASAAICPVVNRLNQDTTLYYGIIFCLFCWPYMVKWYNSGIIIIIILRVPDHKHVHVPIIHVPYVATIENQAFIPNSLSSTQ